MSSSSGAAIRQALRALDVHTLLLGVHDPALPALGRDDIGRGTPYGEGALRFVAWAATLGFDGLQLGPQGLTGAGNASPYDGTLFSRNPLSIALRPLVDEGLLAATTLEAMVAGRSAGSERRVDHDAVFARQRDALDEAHHTFRARRPAGDPAFDEFRRVHADWLARDALFAALSDARAPAHWTAWPERRLFAPRGGEEESSRALRHALARTHAAAIERYAFAQWLVHRQHTAWRSTLRGVGMRAFGDLQIGMSEADAWSLQRTLLADYRMGAPPSRTHPLGQAWNYAIFDPEQYDGAVHALIAARMDKMLAEFDGVRIDHPHGLVCPWAYRPAPAGDDQLYAVRAGARLLSSPDLPDHPALARYAIARAEQLDRTVPRWAEGWIRDLDDEQVRRYGALFDVIVESARARGLSNDAIACEVLSTQPYQLRRVLERHRLGRFRVTQKVDLHDPADVYRSENAAPEDWIMIGNHDTRSIWRLVEAWRADDSAGEHARYLAERLAPSPADRPALAARLASDPRRLAEAKCAELFASRARHVMIFFTDLLGERETYNEPGTVGPENWSLRIPGDFAERYEAMRADGRALDLRKALAMALRARHLAPDLAARLEE